MDEDETVLPNKNFDADSRQKKGKRNNFESANALNQEYYQNQISASKFLFGRSTRAILSRVRASGVTIEGFKTYRKHTVVDLKPGLNVIIGNNGCGKSNLLFAIEFIISHDLLKISSRERENYLHSSNGFQTKEAYVEIVFCNEDRPEKEVEVKLKRVITSQTDVFSLNGKNIEKQQVLNTLQEAGFSKVNPYYIIKQGRINELALASDQKRLEQLTEVVGLLTWKELQPQIDSISKDTESLIAELEVVVTETEERLKHLKNDQQQYDNWSETNTRKRALELLLSKKEKLRFSTRIADLEKNIENAKKHRNGAEIAYAKMRKEMEEAELRYDLYQTDFLNAKEKLNRLIDDGEHLITDYAKLESELADRKSSRTDNSERLNEDLLQVETEISLNEKKLSVISVQYDSAVQEQFEIQTKLDLNKEKRNEMYAISERDIAGLRREIGEITRFAKDGEERLRCIFEEMKEEESKVKEFEEVIERIEAERVICIESRKLNRVEKQDFLHEQKRLALFKSELERNDRQVREDLKELKYKLEQGDFYSRRKQLQTLDAVIEKMKKEAPGTHAFKMASQYRGLVIDQFTCETVMCFVLDAVVGDRLFDGVVDTPKAATEILNWIKKEPYQKKNGFSFYSLDQIRRSSNPLRNYRDGDGGTPSMNYFLPVPGMYKLVEHIFGRVVICKDLKVASKLVERNPKVNYVTLEGDNVKWNGVLSGGYRDLKRSSSQKYFDMKNFMQEEKNKLSYLSEIQQKMEENNDKCNAIASQLQKVENKIHRSNFDILEEELMKLRGARKVSKAALKSKSTFARNLNKTLESNRENTGMLQQEIVSRQVVIVPGNEQIGVMQRNIEEGNELKTMLEKANVVLWELESTKNELESLLNYNLKRKKQDLEQALYAESICGFVSIEANQKAIRQLEEHLITLEPLLKQNKDEVKEVEKLINDLPISFAGAKEEVDFFSEELEGKKKKLEKCQAVTKEIENAIERNKQMHKSATSNILSLGPFENEKEKNILSSYSAYSVEMLKDEFTLVGNQLRRFAHVNQTATVEFVSTEEKLKNLRKKISCFKRDLDITCKFLADVDRSKDPVMLHSLMQLARSFRSVFKMLVPHPGIGYLKWTYDDYDSESDDDEDDPRIPDVEAITGITVKVSFSGSSVVQKLNCLSGGQKSTVSLALLFAILKINRAPFHLLDEADMALDDTYRSKVAALVDTFSVRSQFVATTFRPELLEYASNIIKVSFDAQASRIEEITKEDAFIFVSQQAEKHAEHS